MEADEALLSNTFYQALKQFKQLDSGSIPALDPKYAPLVDNTIALFNKTINMVAQQSVFSSNEELDDIHTTSLKYLLIPYYLSGLYTKIQKREQRADALKKSLIMAKQFLNNCLHLNLVDKTETHSIEGVLHDSANKQAQVSDPNKLREEKIRRHKRDQELSAQLSALTEKLEYGLDEEQLREFTTTQLRLAVLQTLADVALTEQELTLLQMRASMENNQNNDSRMAQKPLQPKPGPMKVTRVFNVDGKIQMREEVFQPGWRQPTISIEEAGMWDLKYAQQGAKVSAEREKQEQERKDQQTSEEREEEERQKTSEWSDWKDDHPSGSGNTGYKGYTY
jgi:hypothetical protein